MEFSGLKYVDMTTLAGVQQVQIKVMVAEASRTAIRQLGINAFLNRPDLNLASQIGPDVGGALNPGGANSSATTLFANFPNSDFSIFIQALAENQYLRVLAEPSLVALSGEEANFLAGGEFPIPVVQNAGGTSDNGNALSIEYKKFGVQLHFRPTVTGDGTIRLHVAPEVSELSNTGAIVLEGFSIPGLLTRRAETTVELRSGQTFGMAGLISQTTQARSSRVPGLGDLPILGALFRSVRYQHGDTELVLLVTASLVDPLTVANRPPVPGEFHVMPNDWEVYALGRIEGEAKARISESDAEWLRKTGLNRLRGPGAWASYDSRSAVGAADMGTTGNTIGTARTDVIAPTAAPSSPAGTAAKRPAAKPAAVDRRAPTPAPAPTPSTRPAARPGPARTPPAR
jgi:pilus assembly protein CpaC